MKKISFWGSLVLACLMAFSFASCSEDDVFTSDMAGAWQSIMFTEWIKHDGKIVQPEESYPKTDELLVFDKKGRGRCYHRRNENSPWVLDTETLKVEMKGNKVYFYEEDYSEFLYVRKAGDVMTFYFTEHDVNEQGVKVESYFAIDYQKIEMPDLDN